MIISLNHHPWVRGSMLQFVDLDFSFNMVDKYVDFAVVGRCFGWSIDDNDDDVSGIPKVIAPFPQNDPLSPVVTYSSYQSNPITLFPTTSSSKTHCQLFLQLHYFVVNWLHGKNGQRKAIAVVVMEVDETLMKSRWHRWLCWFFDSNEEEEDILDLSLKRNNCHQ